MFEKFGEMDSFEELNELAENLFNEGDIESIKIMAKENGIPEDYAEMYIDRIIPFLSDALIAANGKLDLECKELEPKKSCWIGWNISAVSVWNTQKWL